MTATAKKVVDADVVEAANDETVMPATAKAKGDDGQKWIAGHVTIKTVKGNEVAVLEKKDYLGFMETRGVTAKMIDSVDAAHAELISGMYRYQAESLREKVKAAKEAGDKDWPSTKVCARIYTAHGRHIDMTNTAAKITQPTGLSKSEDPTITYCSTTVRANFKWAVDKKMIQEYEESLKEDFGDPLAK